MRSPSLLIAVMLCPPAAAAHSEPPAAPAAAAATASALADDPRLDRRIDVRATGDSIRELLLGLSGDDLLLAVGPSCADQKLFVRMNGRSLRDLMFALEELLPGAWTRVDEKTYRLSLTDEARRRRDRWWKLVAEQREHSRRALEEAALRAMRGTPDEFHDVEHAGLRELFAGSAALFQGLPPELQERIAGALHEKALDGGSSGSLDTEVGVDVLLRYLPDAIQSQLRDTLREYHSPSADSPNLTVQFTNLGRTLLASVSDGGQPLFDGNAVFHQHIGAALGFSPDTLMRGLDHSTIADLGFSQDQIPKHWKPLIEYAKSRVWDNGPLERVGRRLTDDLRRPVVLEILAEELAIPLVADYHSATREGLSRTEVEAARAAFPDRIASEGREKVLAGELDRVAARFDASWKRASGVYLVRNNRWYRDDLLEVPNKPLDRWIAHRRSRMVPLVTWAPTSRTRTSVASPVGRPQGQVIPTVRPAAASAPLNLRRMSYPPPARMTAVQLQEHLDWEAEVVAELTPLQVSYGLGNAVAEEGRGVPRAAQGETPEEAMAEVVRQTTGRRVFTQDARQIIARRPLLEFYALLDRASRAALIAGTLDPGRLTARQREKAVGLLAALAQEGETGRTLGLDSGFRRLVLRDPTASSPAGNASIPAKR